MFQSLSGDSWASGVARSLFKDDETEVDVVSHLHTEVYIQYVCMCQGESVWSMRVCDTDI